MTRSTPKPRPRPTAREKLRREHASHGKLEPITPKLAKWLGRSRAGGTLLIPRPMDVDGVMRGVRKGRLLTMSGLRAKLAADAGADAACPLCTGIFARLAAEAAEEERTEGKARVTPYWRLVRDDGKLNDKFPGGATAQARRLRDEGFTVLPGKGKQPPRVADKYLPESRAGSRVKKRDSFFQRHHALRPSKD